jgi:hypothetical protein
MPGIRPLLALVAFALAACTDTEDVQRAVDEVESEVFAHCDIVAAAASLQSAQRELDRHVDAVDSDVGRVRSRLEDLDDVCETDRRGVWDAVFDVDARIDVYVAAAGDMSAVAPWIDLCDAYADDMDRALATLRARLDDLPCW